MSYEKKLIYADDLLTAIRDDHNINGAHFARIRRHIEAAPAVEAVPVVHGRNNKAVKTPCDLCIFSPPSSMGGKPCTMCAATGRTEYENDD